MSSVARLVLRHREVALKGSLWLLLVLGVSFSVSSFDAAGKCYVLPCVSDDMASMYKVNTGLSFHVLLSGFLFILQPVYGLWFLRVKCSELVAGGYISGSIFCVVLAMMNAVSWGTQASMMASMVQYEREGHLISTDTSLHATFATLSTLATLIFLLGVLFCCLLCAARDLICEGGAVANRYHFHDPMERRGLRQTTYQGIALDEDTELDDPEGIGSI